MFGKDRGSFGPPSSQNESYKAADKLLSLADAANARGNLYEAVHLYLAAFESATAQGKGTFQPAIEGLGKAWELSCQLKDRSLAEHVFEKSEPYLAREELAEHAEALQRLALDKLEEFGFSRDDLQDMADMVSADFAGALKESRADDGSLSRSLSSTTAGILPSIGVVPWPQRSAENKTDDETSRAPDQLRYADIAGYSRAIDEMNKRGIGLSDDEQFAELLVSLSKRHGIDSLPAFETLVFRAHSREDANQFMLATAQEIGAPGVRMYMDQTPLGYPVLCVVTTTDFRMNPTRGGFEGPGSLLLEDIDLWGEPFTSFEGEDEDGLPPFAHFSRGAREAIMFIRSAVENPDVHVMASLANSSPVDEFFVDLLGPLSFVDIDVPNASERASVWKDAFTLYPSLRMLGAEELVRLSANLSRNDIYLAAREAVDQAFRESVEQRTFVPVTRDNIYDKIAAYQPLDSDEYHEIEQSAVDSLRNELDSASLDDLLERN